MDTHAFRKPLLGILISASLLAGCNKQEEPQQDASALVERAIAYEKNGQYRAAFIELRNALGKDPVNLAAKLKMADLQLKTGQPKSASLTLESIKPAPSDNQYVELYAEALLGQEQFKSTLEFIDKNQAQCASRCLSLQGDALLAMNDAGNAEKSFNAALAKDAGNVNAKLGLVKTYYQQKQTAEGDALLNETITAHPDSTDALLLKASLLINANKQSEAEEILNKALFTLPSTDIITPKRIVIIESLVDILTLQGRTEEALTYSKTLADLDPKGSELRTMMDEAIALYNAKDYQGSRAILEKINQEASNSKVKTLLGVIDYMSGDFDAASTLLESGINVENSTATTKTILVNSYLGTGQLDKALAFLEKDYQTNPDDIDTINLYANTLLRSGNVDKAFPLLEKSLQLKADQPTVHIAQFYYHLQKRNLDAATTAINRAYQLAPNNQSILTLYLGFKARNNKLDEAIAELDALIGKDGNNAYFHYLSGYLYSLKNAGDKNTGDKIEAAYKKSLAIDNSLQNPAHLALAKYYLQSKAYDAALQNYLALNAQGLDEVEVYKGIITARELKGEKDTAIQDVSKQATEKNSVTARLVLAEYYLANKNPAAAVSELDSIASSEKTAAKKTALTPLLLAMPTDISGDTLATFKRLLVKAISDQPKNTALLYKLIDLELVAKNIDSVNDLIAKLKPIDKSFGPYFYESRVASVQNDPQKAVAIAKSGWEALKNDAAANYYFTILAANKAPTEAFIDEWVTTIPDSFNARLYKALAVQASEPAKAIQLYENLLGDFPNSFQVLNNLAWLYQENGDSRALATAEKAYKANPNDAAVLDTYGWILFKNKQLDKAQQILEQALKLQPDQAEIREHYNTVKAANAG